MRVKLNTTTFNNNIFVVFNLSTAVIASVLQDIRMITDIHFSLVVNKCKIRSEKCRVKSDLKYRACTPNEKQFLLHFKNRKDDT